MPRFFLFFTTFLSFSLKLAGGVHIKYQYDKDDGFQYMMENPKRTGTKCAIRYDMYKYARSEEKVRKLGATKADVE